MRTGALAGLFTAIVAHAVQSAEPVFPGAHWETLSPERAGLSSNKLVGLAQHVGGRGCVVRHGYMVFTWGDAAKSSDVASAFKPLLSSLLFIAIQEGKLASVDAPVADFEPRLKSLNNGKDASITWRHLASQTSGYGLTEPPGAAYSYNDYALALYYDMLTEIVFGTHGTDVLRTRLAEPLQFEDACTFNAFGPNNRPGRLALSVRDFARFGLLYLRQGKWGTRQLLRPEHVRSAIGSPIPAKTPLTGGREAAMLPGQRTIGGTRNITSVGPGYYSFNWWLNRTNQLGQRLLLDAPEDAFVASGHGGKRVLFLAPSLDLIVCWNDSKIDDHDQSPENPNTKMNRAARLIREAAAQDEVQASTWAEPAGGADKLKLELQRSSSTTLGIKGTQFTVNGKPAFLYGLSYYGALGASREFMRRDLDDAQRFGFNWVRVWANWRAFGADAAAVDGEGHPLPAGMPKLQWLVAECDRRGMVVDVTLSRGNGVTGPPRLQTLETHRRAVETLVTALRPFRNWYLDLSNERNIRDKRYASFGDLESLRELARQLDPGRLVTASQGGDVGREELRKYLQTARVDFISPHRPRDAASPAKTEAQTREYLSWMSALGRVVPVHYQEPFRRGYAKWQPGAGEFVADAHGAKAGGAAGWCFHNGDQRDHPEGRPRRSFDLRERRLFDQLDPKEKEALARLAAEFGGAGEAQR